MKFAMTSRHYLAACMGLIMSLCVSSANAACETQFKAWQDKKKNATPNTVKDAQQLEFAYNNCMKRETPPAKPAAPVPVYTPPKPTQADEQRQAASRLDSCERTLEASLKRGWQEQAAGYKVILDGNKTHSKAHPGKFDALAKENGQIKVSLDGIKPAYSRDKKPAVGFKAMGDVCEKYNIMVGQLVPKAMDNKRNATQLKAQLDAEAAKKKK